LRISPKELIITGIGALASGAPKHSKKRLTMNRRDLSKRGAPKAD
jgi:hypothetical protein